MQQYMVEWFVSLLGSLDEDPEIFNNCFLARKILEFGRPENFFNLLLGGC